MQASRRNILKIIGGGTILAAGGAGIFLTTRTPAKALAPWSMAGSYGDPRKDALSYALLAPNPHNRQPWEVDLSKEGIVTIYRNKEKNLPETDPHDRQLTIGMGCFLELMIIAASQTRHGVKLDLFPEGEDGPVAVAEFLSNQAEPDPAFAHVLNRRSCKEPFEDRSLPRETVNQLMPHALVITEPARVAEIRQMTQDAMIIETHTPRTMKESVDLMRIGKSEINANPDGIDLGGPFLESLSLAGILTRESQMDTSSTGFVEGEKQYQAMLAATSAYATIKTQGNTRQDQINAGRRWLRLNLKTTELGLSLHPVSQSLQEFPEMVEQYKKAHQLLAEKGETVQMLGRLGYGPKVSESPRWPLDNKIIDE